MNHMGPFADAANAIPAAQPDRRPNPDWLDGAGEEPVWPKDKPTTHVCDGCGRERPVEVFEVQDTFAAGEYVPLVRCDECRAKRPVPFDDREAKP